VNIGFIWNNLGPVGFGGLVVSLIAIIRAVRAARKRRRSEAALDVIVAATGAWIVFANTQERMITRSETGAVLQQIMTIPRASVPRHLTDDVRSKLQAAASNSKGDVNVFITANGHDADASQYAGEIGAALYAGGMDVAAGKSLFGAMPLTRLAVTYNSSTKASAFIAALHDALGPFPEKADERVPVGQVKIWVNAQKMPTLRG